VATLNEETEMAIVAVVGLKQNWEMGTRLAERNLANLEWNHCHCHLSLLFDQHYCCFHWKFWTNFALIKCKNILIGFIFI